MRNGKLLAWVLVVWTGLGLFHRLPVSAQESTNLTLPTDRTLGSKFSQLPALIEKGQFNEVTLFLGGLLGGEGEDQIIEDTFFLDQKKGAQPQGLKAEAQRLLGLLPEKGHSAYQLQFGFKAEKLLTDAIETGSVPKMEEVSRRFFHTSAGYQATFLLGLQNLDHGHPLAAAQTFEMLLSVPFAQQQLEPSLSLYAATAWLWAGKPERAREILVAWKQAGKGEPVNLGGKAVPLFSNEKNAVIWLSQLVGEPVLAGQAPADSWTMFRGDAARNSQTEGGTPLFSKRWQVRIANDPAIEKFIAGLESYSRQKNVALIPAFHPLAVGKYVIARSVRDVMAIDFETGKRIWEVRPQVDDGFERLVRAGHNSTRTGEERSQLVEHLGRRIWDDSAFGTMSTDGERVFVVQDLPLVVNENYAQGFFFGGPQVEETLATSNRLSALALDANGHTLWDLGGKESVEESLQEAFFLGAPLPLEGRLYALAEIRGGIRLLVIEAESGRLLWSQQLADVEFNIGQHSERRLAGATPSYGNGILICPIGVGAVVAVDVSNRTLKWAYRYPEKEELYGQGMFGSRYRISSERENDRWIDNTPTIVGDKVILTPVDSARLHCLNLFDGAPAWEPKRRGDNLYVACVHKGKIILIGTEHITAIDLKDGGQGWPEGMLTLPSGSLPSGRGFYSDSFYYLPLSSAEVAKIDLDSGKIVSTTKSRDGRIPGNLICHDGMVLSQNVDYLDKYFQLEPLQTWVQKKLDENPQDALALLRKGELALAERKIPAAVELLRQAFHQAQAQEASSATQLEAREMLMQSLLEGLRVDFATYRDSVAELEPLMDQPDQRTALLRLQAAGLQKTGDHAAALDAYLKLLALEDPSQTELETVQPGHQVRRDRWLAAQLRDLYANADAETKEKMERIVSERLDSLDASTSLTTLKTAYQCYAFHPRQAEIALKLCDRLSAAGHNLEAELLLEELLEAKHPETRAAATVRLARLYAELKQYDLAGKYYHELCTTYADVTCLPEQTGGEVFAVLPRSEQALLASATVPPYWPHGEVRSQVRNGGSEQMFRSSRLLEVRGETSDYFRDMSFSLDFQQFSLIGSDGTGHTAYRIPLHAQDEQYEYEVDPSTTHAAAKGRVLFISMGNEILAVDTLHTQNAGRQNVLWKQDLNEYSVGLGAGSRFMHLRHVRVPGGPIRIRAEDGNGNPVGNIGLAGPDTVILQKHETLVALHIITGQTLWTRSDVAPGCDLFGDAEILLAVPPNSTEARVFRTTDGTELEPTSVASESKRVATIGRRIVSYARTGGQITLALIDPWTKQTVWSLPLERSTQIWNVQNESVAAMEPSGRFRLLRMRDGEALIDEPLDPEPRMNGILVIPGRHDYILITHHDAPFPTSEEQISPVPGEPTDPPLLTGKVYAFSRSSGKPLWPSPATIQHRGLRFPQPMDLPLLIFAQNINQGVDDEQGKSTVMCLDRRTGQMVYSDDSVRTTQRSNFNYQAEGNPKAGTVTLSFPMSTITLTFTDQAQPPEPPEQESASKGKKAESKGFFGIFQSTIKSMGTPPDERKGDIDLFPEEEEKEEE